MRILLVVPVFTEPFGGPVTVVKSIAKELAKKHEVIVYTTTALDPKHDTDPKIIYNNGYTTYYFKRNFVLLSYANFFGQLNISLDMMNAIKNNLKDFDIIHIHSYQQFPDVITSYYAKKYTKPYIIQTHGSLPNIRKVFLKTFFDIFFGKQELINASIVIALNDLEARQYRSMGVPKEKISIIPNGIELSNYIALPPRGLFKRKFSIKDEEKIVLYMGRIHKDKGIDFLIKSYSYLIKNGTKNVRLVIAGPDDGHMIESKRLVNSLELNEYVLFTDMLSENDKIKAYVDSSVCAYLSPFEPFGLVSLEAAVCGTPVIVSSKTKMSQIINEGEFGFSVKYDDSNQLNKILYIIINSDNLKDEMGQKGRQFIFDHFDWSKIITKIEAVYNVSIMVKKSNYKHGLNNELLSKV